MTTTQKKIVLAAMSFGLFSMVPLSADSNENMVNSIMKLRADVENLYTKIDENKENYKSQMKSYAMQSADNEAQINRKETAIKVAQSEIADLEKKIAEQGAATDDLKPLLFDAIDELETLIKGGFPFKVEERLSDLAKIKQQLKEDTITQEKALSLVWASYDDALRLTKEIGLFKQQITIDGETKLAKVGKIGTAMLFFTTSDGQVGYAAKKEGGYEYRVVTDSKGQKEITALFDALQKQIRTGYFSLPNALIVSGVK
ncbi:MAG: DUF3450 family protein [Campylobacterota bacterium]|nr:DUF3450 family protein [Campylobacterota bacterium]